MKKIIRITTIPGSLGTLLRGQLKFMSDHYEMIGISGSGARLEEVERDEGIKTLAVEMTRQITPLKDIKAVFQLYKIFRKEKPFIVHTHTPKAGTLGMLAAKLARVPNRLHTIAGLPLLEATGNKRRLLNFVEKITYGCATMILPNSFAMKDIVLKEKFCKEEKLKVIGNGSSNGIDIEHYHGNHVSEEEASNLRAKLQIDENDIVFIFIGRVVKDKGVNELVLAFDAVSKINKNAKLIIVGPHEKDLDPINPKSEDIIRSNKNIHEVGMIMDIRPYVVISDILAFPSYREGFPNVVLQASCMEKPCIVTDINGSNEIIEHGFNGLIIPPKNVEKLKDAMLYLINNPEKTLYLANNSRQNIIDKYQREYIWDELLKLYKSLE